MNGEWVGGRYWLSSRYAARIPGANQNYVDFGLEYVFGGDKVISAKGLFNSDSSNFIDSAMIRPIVSVGLKDNGLNLVKENSSGSNIKYELKIE